jgi:hypothetical protein
MKPTCHSLHLRADVPSHIPTGSTVWPGLTSPGSNHCWRSDGRGNSTDFPQPRGSAASPVRGNCEGASGTKLSRLTLFFSTGWCGGELPGARGSSSPGFGCAGGPPCLRRVAVVAMIEEAGWVSWSSCARGPPAWRNHHLWPRSWPAGASCICLRLVFLA